MKPGRGDTDAIAAHSPFLLHRPTVIEHIHPTANGERFIGEKLNCAAMHDDKINLLLLPSPWSVEPADKSSFQAMETRPGRVYCFGIERLRHPDCFAAIGAIDDDEVGPASQPHPLPADFAAANQWQASNAKLPSPPPFFALFSAERRPKTISRSRGGYCGRIGGDICQYADKSGFPLVSGRENW